MTATLAHRIEAAGATLHGPESCVDAAARLRSMSDRLTLSPSAQRRAPVVAAALGGFAVPPRDWAAHTEFDVGVVVGELVVVETGSVLVDDGDLPDRLVTMLSRHLVALVPSEAVVESLSAVGEWLASKGSEPTYGSLVTGPSRTADIERSLTIGVQGPSALEVVLVDGLEPRSAPISPTNTESHR